MKYQELLDEYRQLLQRNVQLQQQMQQIPKGYIVTKRISGKDYYYLQYSVQGKKKSQYIRQRNKIDQNVLHLHFNGCIIPLTNKYRGACCAG